MQEILREMRFKISIPLVLIILLTVVIRLIALLSFSPINPAGGDFLLFDRMAKNLLALGNFGGEPAISYGSPNINPGFAFWLAGPYFFFAPSVSVFFAAQVFLSILVVWLTYLLGQKIFDKKTGLFAALIAAVFPPAVLLTIEPTNTLLFSTLFLAAFYFWWRLVKDGKLKFALAAGGFLGLAALTESIAFYFPVVFSLWLIGWAVAHKLSYRRALISVLTLFLVFAAVLAPWAYRNFKVAGVDGVKIVSKGELQLASPQNLKWAGQKFVASDALPVGLGKMFLAPYGLWLLDRENPTSYRQILKDWFNGRATPSSRIILVIIFKVLFLSLWWLLLILTLFGACEFKPLGSLIGLLLTYSAAAVIGFAALQGLGGADWELVSHPSVFLVPFWPVMAVLTAGWLVGKSRLFSLGRFDWRQPADFAKIGQ